METNTQNFKCPLCGSILVRDKWIKITGQWSEFEKERDVNKKLLEKYKKEKEEQEKKYKLEIKKATKSAEETGIAKGIKKEKSERERMSKMLQNQAKSLIASNKKIQELEKQLKEGKTPQTAGFDYEKEVQKMLAETFPEDKIQPTGKKGDAIQFIKIGEEVIGSILYECKKTDKFSNAFLFEAKRHQEISKSDYAVIVTHAAKQGKSKFFVENSIVVIDPLGFLDIAFLLRNTLLEIHRMKLTKQEAKEKGVQILKYMQTGEFKTNMLKIIEKAKDAYQLLLKEVKGHHQIWMERVKIYHSIHENTQLIRQQIGQIVTGKPVALETFKFELISENRPLQLEAKN